MDNETLEKHKNLSTHYVASHKIHHKRQRSVTLRRGAVKKPVLRDIGKIIHQSQGALYQKQIETNNIIVSKDIATKRRSEVARSISKSPFVKKFVKTIPKYDDKPHSSIDKLTANVQEIPLRHPLENLNADSRTASVEEANAASKLVKNSRRKIKSVRQWTILCGLFLILLVVLACMWEPLINLKFVSYQAGFNAVLPKQIPSGYIINHRIDYDIGSVVLTYNKNSSYFTISEQSYTLNSNQLKLIYVDQNHDNYQTVNSGGRTIYLFSDGSATWIHNNIWFMLKNSSNIPFNNIVQIAASS
jgi:hypothetical protein